MVLPLSTHTLWHSKMEHIALNNNVHVMPHAFTRALLMRYIQSCIGKIIILYSCIVWRQERIMRERRKRVGA